MKRLPLNRFFIAAMFFTAVFFSACSSPGKEKADQLEANKKMYAHVWDEILNKGKLQLFNDSNWVKNAVVHASPNDIVGIDSIKAYYANFLTGFSNIQFTVKDIFGEGDKMVKYWNFKGTHSGNFFGIPATGKTISIDGTTLIRMENGKIAEERDFFDNLDFMTQLGQIPASGK
ncbi:MAG TPA: ester cyclase [Chitinophagaceae bacterium]|nr:ester cyclase [Chitinophagaceae bacterium]